MAKTHSYHDKDGNPHKLVSVKHGETWHQVFLLEGGPDTSICTIRWSSNDKAHQVPSNFIDFEHNYAERFRRIPLRHTDHDTLKEHEHPNVAFADTSINAMSIQMEQNTVPFYREIEKKKKEEKSQTKSTNATCVEQSSKENDNALMHANDYNDESQTEDNSNKNTSKTTTTGTIEITNNNKTSFELQRTSIVRNRVGTYTAYFVLDKHRNLGNYKTQEMAEAAVELLKKKLAAGIYNDAKRVDELIQYIRTTIRGKPAKPVRPSNWQQSKTNEYDDKSQDKGKLNENTFKATTVGTLKIPYTNVFELHGISITRNSVGTYVVQFLLDKQRHLGCYKTQEMAEEAIELLKTKLAEGCYDNTKSIDELIQHIRTTIRGKPAKPIGTIMNQQIIISYLYFSNVINEEMKERYPEATFLELGKLMAEEFLKLTANERMMFDELATKDRMACEDEIEGYGENKAESSTGHGKKDHEESSLNQTDNNLNTPIIRMSQANMGKNKESSKTKYETRPNKITGFKSRQKSKKYELKRLLISKDKGSCEWKAYFFL